MDLETRYLFVIDTDSYTGNFERELCAYCTGFIGECGVGGKEQKIFYEETKCDEDSHPFREGLIDQYYPDKHGRGRPAEIWPTIGGQYRSVAIHLNEIPNEYEVYIILTRAEKYLSEKNIKFLSASIVGISCHQKTIKEFK